MDKDILRSVLDFAGVKCSGNNSIKILKNGSLLPSVSYRKKEDRFVLSYCSPFGLQSLYFEQADFFDDFADLKLNDFAFYIINFFSLTKSVLISAKHQNKSIHRVVKLQPKPAAILKCLGLYSGPLYREGRNSEESLPLDLQSCDRNIQLAISKSALACDLSFFDLFFDSYNDKLSALGQRKIPRHYALKIFSQAVDNFQKTL